MPCPRDGVRMRKIISAEKTNVAESMMKAVAVPAVATITPPIAGPRKSRHVWRTDCASAFASTIRGPETRSGMIAPRAGPKNASPAA